MNYIHLVAAGIGGINTVNIPARPGKDVEVYAEAVNIIVGPTGKVDLSGKASTQLGVAGSSGNNLKIVARKITCQAPPGLLCMLDTSGLWGYGQIEWPGLHGCSLHQCQMKVRMQTSCVPRLWHEHGPHRAPKGAANRGHASALVSLLQCPGLGLPARQDCICLCRAGGNGAGYNLGDRACSACGDACDGEQPAQLPLRAGHWQG
jgi:hypothetical protein